MEIDNEEQATSEEAEKEEKAQAEESEKDDNSSDNDGSDSNSNSDSDDKEESGEKAEEKPKSAPKTNPKGVPTVPHPSGLNRTARRRLVLIDRQREAIMKRLKVTEPNEEVEKKLQEWTTRFDELEAARLRKRFEKKEKEKVKRAKKAARSKGAPATKQ